MAILDERSITDRTSPSRLDEDDDFSSSTSIPRIRQRSAALRQADPRWVVYTSDPDLIFAASVDRMTSVRPGDFSATDILGSESINAEILPQGLDLFFENLLPSGFTAIVELGKAAADPTGTSYFQARIAKREGLSGTNRNALSRQIDALLADEKPSDPHVKEPSSVSFEGLLKFLVEIPDQVPHPLLAISLAGEFVATWALGPGIQLTITFLRSGRVFWRAFDFSGGNRHLEQDEGTAAQLGGLFGEGKFARWTN